MTRFLAILAFLVWVADGCAAPVVTSVSGSPANGNAITIYGAGFGVKSTAAPIVWDNFESAADGESLASRTPTIGPSWGVLGSPVASSGNQRTNSTRSFYKIFSGTSYQNSLVYTNQETTTGAKKFISFWWRAGRYGSSEWSLNMKPWMMFGSSADSPMYYIGDGTGASDPGFRASQDLLGTAGYLGGCGNMASIENEWVRIDTYIVLSDLNTNNGRFDTWMHKPADSVAISNCMSRNPVETRNGAYPSAGFRQWAIGSYMSTDSGRSSVVYIDDVYIDDTLSRVEVCDGPSMATSTKCEIQPATSWSDTEVAVNFNAGAYTSQTTVYLYIIDSNGVVSNATSLTVGSAGSQNITCYKDLDNDLYGTGETTVVAGGGTCPPGYYSASHFTNTSTDCNDNAASINPGGVEICGDGIDQDCNGSDLACAPTAARVRWGSGAVGWGTGTTGQ